MKDDWKPSVHGYRLLSNVEITLGFEKKTSLFLPNNIKFQLLSLKNKNNQLAPQQTLQKIE